VYLHGDAEHLRDARLPLPTESALTPLVQAIRSLVSHAPDLTGTEGLAWNAFTMIPYVYTVGSGLGVHLDAGQYAGSFVYFLHTEWDLDWGGELMVLDSRTAVRPEDDDWLHIPSQRAGYLTPGVATAVLARPNRLALLSPEAIHMVSAVHSSAGTRARTSVAGFLLRPLQGYVGEITEH